MNDPLHMTTFRDAISRQIEAHWDVEVDEIYPYMDAPETQFAILAHPEDVAGSVLESAEMQAIRQALLTFAANVEEDWGLFSVEAVLRVVDGCCLPPHVVDWLME